MAVQKSGRRGGRLDNGAKWFATLRVATQRRQALRTAQTPPPPLRFSQDDNFPLVYCGQTKVGKKSAEMRKETPRKFFNLQSPGGVVYLLDLDLRKSKLHSKLIQTTFSYTKPLHTYKLCMRKWFLSSILGVFLIFCRSMPNHSTPTRMDIVVSKDTSSMGLYGNLSDKNIGALFTSAHHFGGVSLLKALVDDASSSCHPQPFHGLLKVVRWPNCVVSINLIFLEH